MIEHDDKREEITKRAYEDVAASGAFTYDGFTKFVIETTLGDRLKSQTDQSGGLWDRAAYYWTRFTDRIKWVILFFSYKGFKFFRE